MPPTTERAGRPAAPGLAAGPLFRLTGQASTRAASGDPARERMDLEAAVRSATGALAALTESVDEDAGAILEFQIAILEDTVLSDPAMARIEKGVDAATAWTEAVAPHIADYKATDDEYFRARATDLADLRDRVLRVLAGEEDAELPSGAVLTGEDLTPSRFLSVDWSKGGGLALSAGSPSSHVAMLARSRGVPMVVGIGPLDVAGHETAIVDGDRGRVVLSPAADDWQRFKLRAEENAGRHALEAEVLNLPAMTRDGAAVSVMINIAEPEELADIDPAVCDGIGLVRTEFLFHGPGGLPDEETQYLAYRRMAEWAGRKPVVLRTLDAGGDKPVEGLTIPGESNPFLGTRGVRLSLARPDVFLVQLRAMVRAAVHGSVKVMLPMVTVPEEVDAAAALLDQAMAEVTARGQACRKPPLGIMVEVPAVAIEPGRFANAAFFSIGSNDLTQYVTAAARDIAAVAGLNDGANPAVISLIRRVAEAGAAMGRDVSLCGDMGGDPVHLPALIAAGIRTVSVAPPHVGRAKLAIAHTGAG